MAEKKQFKAESKRLLDLMINSIYTHKEIFLRELISNASDASDKLYYKALTENISSINRDDLVIEIGYDKDNRILTIKDHGIGMDKDELETHLGTIANSGSFEFKNENDHDDIDIIGQFGVGFYAAFMVAKKVEVISKKYGSDQGYTWVSEVSDGYEIFETNVSDHGTISVPVPATSEIFAASNVVARQIDIDTELVTPTGAAIIAELSSSFQPMPPMNVQKIGWGCGTKELNIPNVLKVSLGTIDKTNDEIIVMETNIDDCSSEILAYTAEKLFENGALDVFFTPIYMKKNRPAYRLSTACKEDKLELLQNIIFRETTTIGIRYRREERKILARKAIELDTPYGKIAAKEVTNNDETYVYPEYESIKRLAKEHDLAVKEIYKLIK